MITLEAQLSAHNGDRNKTKSQLEKYLAIFNAMPSERNNAYAENIQNILNQLL